MVITHAFFKQHSYKQYFFLETLDEHHIRELLMLTYFIWLKLDATASICMYICNKRLQFIYAALPALISITMYNLNAEYTNLNK